MPAQAIALIVIKTVTTKGNIMKKYPINKDFDLVNVSYISCYSTGGTDSKRYAQILVNEHHGDKYIKVSKSKIVIESVGRRTDFLRRCFR